MSEATSLKNKHLRYMLKSEIGWTSYKVSLFDGYRHLGEAELKRTKITLKIEDIKYLGKIPGLLGGRVELVDETTNIIIYCSKPKFLKFPMIILDGDGNEIFRVNRHFWESRYAVIYENQEIAFMEKKGFFSRTYELVIVKSPLGDPRDLMALFMIILLMERRDMMIAAAAAAS